MGVLKNDVGRPSNKTIKIRFILKAVLLIVVAGGLFLGGYLLNGGTNKNDIKEETSEKITIDNDDAERIMIDFFGENYKLLVLIQDGVNFDSDYIKTLSALRNTKVVYNKAELPSLVKTSDNSYCIWNYKGACLTNGYIVRDEKDVEKTYKKLFENGKLIKEESISLFCDEFYIYNEGYYFWFEVEGCGSGMLPLVEVYKAYKQNDKLFITMVYAKEVGYIEDVGYGYILKDGSRVTSAEFDEQALTKKYGDKMQQYELEFKQTDYGYKYVKSTKLK